MLPLREEEGGREPCEQEEARGEQEVGRRELLQRDVVHGAVHEDEDKVFDAVDESDGAVQHGSLFLVDGLGEIALSTNLSSSQISQILKGSAIEWS